MNRTAIEYLDFTWNPIAMRCTPVSEGCLNCWHLRMCDRMAANPAFLDDVRAAYAGKGLPVLVEKRLEEPEYHRKPAQIGSQFMGDLFHEALPFSYINSVFDMMVNHVPGHTYIVLTKRAERMAEFLQATRWLNRGLLEGPTKNVWLGVTAENQRCADERIPLLLATPAAVRFVSVEPMLGPVDLFDPDGHIAVQMEETNKRESRYPADVIDWVICGAETGPGARPMDLAWARDLRDQCREAGVPFFFKRSSSSQETPPDLMVREWPERRER